MGANKIDSIHVYHLRIPLKQPYVLSFKSIREFDIIFVTVRDGERIGYGETVPLYGYSDESFSDAWNLLAIWKKEFEGKTVKEIKNSLLQWKKTHPFSTTAIWSALETLQGQHVVKEDIYYPLLGTLHASEKKGIAIEIKELIADGYTTIKVKVGMKDVETDIRKIRYIQEVIGDQALIRIDANQGYDFDEAKKLVQHIDSSNIELFEQPFSKTDWNSMIDLAKISPIPLMMDESINGEADINRVISTRCAEYVKFKLMKAGSIVQLNHLIQKAQSEGLKVVLGNGVAGEVGNLHEILVAHSLLTNAGEMNGFLKLKEMIFEQPIKVIDGKVYLPKGFEVSLNMEKFDKFCTAVL